MSEQKKDLDPNLDNDEVWDLLNNASTAEPSKHFAKEVLAQIQELPSNVVPMTQTTAWWKTSASKLVVLGVGAAAACALLVTNILPSSQPDTSFVANPTGSATSSPPSSSLTPTQEVAGQLSEGDDLNSIVATEMILAAAEDPNLYSSAQLSALIGF